MDSSIYRKLEGFKSFANLNESEIKRIIQNSSIYDFNRKRTLYFQGDNANTVYFILKGSIDQIKYRTDFSTAKIGVLQEGDWTGIPEVLSNAPYLADAITSAHSQLLSIAKANFTRLLEIKKFEEYILRYISKSYFALHSQLEYHTPMQKLIEFFKLHAEEPGKKPITINITQDSLADFLGFARETINRNLKVLEKKGIISISRGKIKIIKKFNNSL